MIATLTKGNRWRHKVAMMLGGLGLVEKRGIGDAGDDLTVWIGADPHLILSVECKNEQAMSPAKWLTQAETQAPAGRIPIVVAHRRGKDNAEDGYVIMSGRTFVRLLLALTGKVGR
jgi:hypothetical protein